VVLQGYVDSDDDIRIAEELVRSVPGVDEVFTYELRVG
jgi:osmotically-inducible protein OsmY